MAVYHSHGRYYLLLSLAPGKPRESLTPHKAVIRDRAAVEARHALLSRLMRKLHETGQGAFVPRIVDLVLEAPDDGALEKVRAYVEDVLCAGLRVLQSQIPTVKSFAEEWLSGRLRESFPDHVGPLTPQTVAAYRWPFGKYIFPTIGDKPLHLVDLADAKLVLSKIAAPSARRSAAQLLHHLLNLGRWPAEYLQTNPIPPAFIPQPQEKDFDYLRPSEEAQLLACTAIPLERRLVYGLCAREGLRPSEAGALVWNDLGPSWNVIDLTKHKTVRKKGARLWPIALDVRAALGWWRLQSPANDSSELIFPGINHKRLARMLRQDLLKAGVERASLQTSTVGRRRLRAHDLRATFVTLALAQGRAEQWVMDRTGHSSSKQLERYKRASRVASELDLGWLLPLWEALPECAAAYRAEASRCMREGKTDEIRLKYEPVQKMGHLLTPHLPPSAVPKFGAVVLDLRSRIQPAYTPPRPVDAGESPVVFSPDSSTVCAPFRTALSTVAAARLRRAA